MQSKWPFCSEEEAEGDKEERGQRTEGERQETARGKGEGEEQRFGEGEWRKSQSKDDNGGKVWKGGQTQWQNCKNWVTLIKETQMRCQTNTSGWHLLDLLFCCHQHEGIRAGTDVLCIFFNINLKLSLDFNKAIILILNVLIQALKYLL